MSKILPLSNEIIPVDNLFIDQESKNYFRNKITIFTLGANKESLPFSIENANKELHNLGLSINLLNDTFSKITSQKIQEYNYYFFPYSANVTLAEIDAFTDTISFKEFLMEMLSPTVFEHIKHSDFYVVISLYNIDFLVEIDNISALTKQQILEWAKAAIDASYKLETEQNEFISFQPTIKDDDQLNLNEKSNEDDFANQLQEIENDIDKKIEFLKSNEAEYIIAKILSKHFTQNRVAELFIDTQKANPESNLSPLIVTQQNKLILRDFNHQEIILPPVQKAIYLLFLMHPSGIMIKEIGNYKHDLTRIYNLLNNRSDLTLINESIEKICNPFDNSLNEKCSKINATFYKLFNKKISKAYCITGGRNHPKYVPISNSFHVIWESETLKPKITDLSEDTNSNESLML